MREDVGVLSVLTQLLYLFCKVRGAKVVTRFLDNEPKSLQAMVDLLKTNQENEAMSSDEPGQPDDDAYIETKVKLDWKARYLLLLWIGHLMLTPFDLSTVSSIANNEMLMEASFPIGLPLVVVDILHVCATYLGASSNEQSTAAATLVKLVLRPDMRQLGLLNFQLKRAFETINRPKVELHLLNGYLMFTNGIVSSANTNDIHSYLIDIHLLISQIFYQEGFEIHAQLRSSAVSKKLAIKIWSKIIIHVIQHEKLSTGTAYPAASRLMHDMNALEDVVDYLLKSLADRDTQVRYAASKALGVVTTKLESDMAEEVVNAVLGSVQEDVFRDDQGKQNTSAVSAVRWHGLTLTLSHMLFRRSPVPDQLPDVLLTLYGTLAFEQRSATGNSLGSNVRDAANFGLWSLARRYSTKELAEVSMQDQPSHLLSCSAIQITACHLVVSACLDPAGNVRRGSSAALQELIGRHPNTIVEGISLVQIIDYQAVGLRERAMISIALEAAELSEMYRISILDDLFGWRGLRATDSASREYAAASIGRLVNLESPVGIRSRVDEIARNLQDTSTREVELRHGLVLSLAAIFNTYVQRLQTPNNVAQSAEDTLLPHFSTFWNIFGNGITLEAKDLSLPSMKSDLTIAAICSLVVAVAASDLALRDLGESQPATDTGAVFDILTTSLSARGAESILSLSDACQKLFLTLNDEQRLDLARIWLDVLTKGGKSPRTFGFLVGLGAVHSLLPEGSANLSDTDRSLSARDKTMSALMTATRAVDIEVRVVAIRALTLTLESKHQRNEAPGPEFLKAIEACLNDYSINERGDVGSLARFQALLAIERIWTLAQSSSVSILESRFPSMITVQRLALERLDKVRIQAAKCLVIVTGVQFEHSDISSYSYMKRVGTYILRSAANIQDNHSHLGAWLTGFASSAGAGAESFIEPSRQALHDILCSLPTNADSKSDTSLPSLEEVGIALRTLLLTTITSSDDRILLPLLETVCFLLDANILQPLFKAPSTTPSLKPVTLLSLIQRAHYKSTSLPKLLSCIHIYLHLAGLHEIRTEVLKKLVSMLLHPFPRVRRAVAEVIWVVTGVNGLRDMNWLGNISKEVKTDVEAIRKTLLG